MSEGRSLNFIEEIIEEGLKEGKFPEGIHTRFPPEPNGYLHLGHAKSICLNFGLAAKYKGKCNLRFDDTNPVTEETEYVESIKNDIQWLGFQWDELHFTSDYFDNLYAFALRLIQKGLAYVDDYSAEEIAATKGDIGVAGKESPSRGRSIEENLRLFEEMKDGKYADGEKVLRAKIDMAAANLLLRDPVLYRIKHTDHHRTGSKWCIYPMYDFAHGQSDSLENITHSICTLEFIHHRPLYDWFIRNLEIYPSHQYEFARLNLTYTVMSKRKLLQLVNEGYVNGWDDPRMPTISGIRRKGYTPESIRKFAETIGIAKRDNLIDIGLLEFCVREHLNKIADRYMVVLHPVKLVLTNYPDGKADTREVITNPEDPENSSTHKVTFGKELYIEREDFMEEPPKKFFRLAPGKAVRLKHGYIIECESFDKDENGNVSTIYCKCYDEHDTSLTYIPKVKSTIHWVNVKETRTAEIRIYDRLFNVENPAAEKGDFKEYLNPDSLQIIEQAYIEPALAEQATPDGKYQFLRMGYFCMDKDSRPEHLVFNKTVGLKDTWAKEVKKSGGN